MVMIVTATLNPALDPALTCPRSVLKEMMRETRTNWDGNGEHVAQALGAPG